MSTIALDLEATHLVEGGSRLEEPPVSDLVAHADILLRRFQTAYLSRDTRAILSSTA